MSKKYYTRKRFSNNKSRRHKRIHQRGGSVDHLLRFIRGLDINPIFLNRDPIVITLEPNETNDRIKVAYAYAMVRCVDDTYGLLTNSNLRGQEHAEKKRDFLNALHGLSQRYGVTNNDFNDALEDVTLDYEADDDDAIMVNVEDRQEYTVYDAADQMFIEFLKVGPIPVITSSIAERTRSKRPREGPLKEYEQIQPTKKRTSVFTLETTSKPEATITLSDGKQYNINEIETMWASNKERTPLRHLFTEEDKDKIKDFIQYARKGGKLSRKKRKMRKTKKKKY